jgi:tetratricopeptide (TPR) repeat protein/predicted Ser/Thr protein kinase
MIGILVSHYRIVDKLGAGGMGEVYLAEDQHLRRQVAIKFPNLQDRTGEFRRRFEREARVASQLTHANVARVYDYGEASDGRPFLVMELVAGTSLRERLKQGRMEPARAIAIVSGVLRALEEAHANGLVHRDIKPANVMIGPAGEVKVLDFGLAKEILPAPLAADASQVETVTASDTAPGMVAGTPGYMSPEQARGGLVDRRSDLFSTGLLLYYCLTGVAPFSGSDGRELLNQVLNVDPAPPSIRVPGLSKQWDALVAKALRKDPGSRYQSAAEMLADLEALEPSRSSVSRSVTNALVGTRRRALTTSAAAVLTAAAAVILSLGAGPHRPPEAAERMYERGVIALRDGTYYAATRALQKAVELDPEFALAHARLAEAFNEQDDSVRAGTEMLAALPKGSGSSVHGIPGQYIDAIHRTLTRDFAGAAAVYTQLADKVSGAEKAAVLVDLGRVYESNSQTADALKAYQSALLLDTENAAAHLRTGILLGRQRKPNYNQELDRAFELYQTLTNAEGQAEVLFQRGYVLSSSDPAAACAALEKARDMAKAIPSVQQEVAATLQLSAVEYTSGNFDVAGKLAAAGVQRAQSAGMNYLAARGLANLGDVQRLKGDPEPAAISYRASLEVSRRYRMARSEALAQADLAIVDQGAKRLGPAAQEAAAALAYYRKAAFRVESIQCLTLLGRIHRDLGKGDEARADFEEALTAARQIPDPTSVFQAQQGVASVLLTFGHWPEAVEQYQITRKLAEESRNTDNLVRVLSPMAEALWRLGRYPEAESTFAEAESEAENAKARAALETTLLFRKAGMALSRSHDAEAAAMARKVFEDKATSAQTGQSARCLAGLGLARSGRAADGRRLCDPAVASLLEAGDEIAVDEARLAQAEILMAQSEDGAAVDAASQVAESARILKLAETEWRAWALRARALRRRHDAAGAQEAARQALKSLGECHWDAASMQSYLARPDIAGLQREVQDQLK